MSSPGRVRWSPPSADATEKPSGRTIASPIGSPDGRRRSTWAGPGTLVDAVRHKLAELQQHIQAYRWFERIRRSAMTAIRAQKVNIRRYLYPFGLRLKGLEVRGWRTSVFRHSIRRFRFLPRLNTAPRRATHSQATPAARLLKFLQWRDGHVPAQPYNSDIQALCTQRVQGLGFRWLRQN